MITNISKLNRWQAFAIHLALSAVIFSVLYFIIYFIWYPGPFIDLGGWRGIKIVAGIDLVLGPLLTLIVFNAKKKSLLFDLTAIWIIQIGALTYGVWTIESQRPLTQLILDDTLYVLSKADYRNQNVSTGFVRTLKGPYPKLVTLKTETDQTKIAIDLTASQFTGTPMQFRTEDYIDLRNETHSNENAKLINWVTARLNQSTTHGCYLLPLETNHATGEACVKLPRGMIQLKSHI